MDRHALWLAYARPDDRRPAAFLRWLAAQWELYRLHASFERDPEDLHPPHAREVLRNDFDSWLMARFRNPALTL